MFVFVLVCMTVCPFYFCNYLYEEERVGCFALTVFEMYCYCKCPVALPHGDKGLSAVYECGISWSRSLTLC